jgi:hypothetical protein
LGYEIDSVNILWDDEIKNKVQNVMTETEVGVKYRLLPVIKGRVMIHKIVTQLQ